jgi:hypothetical protein
LSAISVNLKFSFGHNPQFFLAAKLMYRLIRREKFALKPFGELHLGFFGEIKQKKDVLLDDLHMIVIVNFSSELITQFMHEIIFLVDVKFLVLHFVMNNVLAHFRCQLIIEPVDLG